MLCVNAHLVFLNANDRLLSGTLGVQDGCQLILGKTNKFISRHHLPDSSWDSTLRTPKESSSKSFWLTLEATGLLPATHSNGLLSVSKHETRISTFLSKLLLLPGSQISFVKFGLDCCRTIRFHYENHVANSSLLSITSSSLFPVVCVTFFLFFCFLNYSLIREVVQISLVGNRMQICINVQRLRFVLCIFFCVLSGDKYFGFVKG